MIFLALALIAGLSCEKKKESTTVAVTEEEKGEINEVKQMISNTPSDSNLYLKLADLYEREAKHDEQIAALLKVIDLKPDAGYAYFKIGTTYGRIHKHEDAVKALEKSIELMPNYVIAYNHLASSYGELGMTDKQIETLRKAIKVRRDYFPAKYNLGLAYLKAGKVEEAKKQYQELKGRNEQMANDLLRQIEAAPSGVKKGK